jgi:hypothetical protein
MTIDVLGGFVKDALGACGARLLHCSDAGAPPMRLAFECASGDRYGAELYPFDAFRSDLASASTRRAHRAARHATNDMIELALDPFGIYVTLLLAMDPERRFFLAADPVLHSPMPRALALPYEQSHVDAILEKGWCTWERDPDDEDGDHGPIEILIGFTPEHFVQHVIFERAALGEDAGHREWVAERVFADRTVR